jgi:DNA-binding transcriptional LysR family regulator
MFVDQSISTFLAVVRSGSLLKASEVVQTSQSTVSYRIQQLEKHLGCELVIRSKGSRGITLSNEGQKFLDIAERLEGLNTEIDRLTLDQEMHLSIGSADVVSQYLLPDFFSELGRRRHEVRYNIETGRGWDLTERVARGHLDCAFTVFEVRSDGVDSRKIAEFPLVAMASRRLIDEYRTGVRESRRLAEDCEIKLDWGPPFETWRMENRLSHEPAFADKAHLAPPLMRHSVSWTTVPSFMVPRLLEEGCSVMDFVSDLPPIGVYMVQRRSRLAAGTRQITLVNELIQVALNQLQEA